MWVIEKHFGSKLHYWCPRKLVGGGSSMSPHSVMQWTEDFREAIKFASAESAHQVLESCLEDIGRVAQHAYIKI